MKESGLERKTEDKEELWLLTEWWDSAGYEESPLLNRAVPGAAVESH